jgi:hypothetical protein
MRAARNRDDGAVVRYEKRSDIGIPVLGMRSDLRALPVSRWGGGSKVALPLIH